METTENAVISDEALSLGKKLLSSVLSRERVFEQGWWKQAELADKLYSTDDSEHAKKTPYNILYSNTEVLQPSLYSATPKPDVRSRYKDKPLKPLPDLVERFLSACADSGHPGTDSFDGAMQNAVLSALVPAMGYVRIRDTLNGTFPISYESGHYKTFLWGKASRWSKVPWVAFKHPMTKTSMGDRFSLSTEDLEEKFTSSEEEGEDKDSCCVYEVWHKESRRVFFLCEEWREVVVRVSPDPLELVGFYPTPGPLMLTQRPGKFEPVTLYAYYHEQAEELNRVTVRLNRVLSAIRVRGAYNSLLGTDLATILKDDHGENELVPSADTALLAQAGGFDKHIWMLPIEKLITVAEQLYKAREAIKVIIYELTGISDIIRGSSVASETATAQDLKAKWGTVRLRKMQKLVGDYARDLFRLTVDAAARKVPAEQWKTITQLNIPTQAEKQAFLERLQQLRMQQMQIPPEMEQQAQIPSIEELLLQVQNDALRTFIINIQTNSTIDIDTAQDKAEVGDFMNAMGQLSSGLQPLMALGPTGIEAVKALLTAVCRRFKFGSEAAEVIEKIKPPPPQNPNEPSPEEKQVNQARAQAELEKIQVERELLKERAALERAELSAQQRKLQIDVATAELTLQARRLKMQTNAPGAPNANV